MNKSEFRDLVSKIQQSTMKVDEQDVRKRLGESVNVLLIASVSRTKFSKLVAFLKTLDCLKRLSVWAQEEYRECVRELNGVSIEFINHEGKYTTESTEYGVIEEKKPYDVIIFCIDKVNQYRNLNLEIICSKLNHDGSSVVYSFDCLEQFVQYLELGVHIESLEKYKEAIEYLSQDR